MESRHNKLCQVLLLEVDAVYRLACYLCEQPQDAESLVEETYVCAFKCAATFPLQGQSARPWLFKILHKLVSARHAARISKHGSEAHPLGGNAATPGVEESNSLDLGCIAFDDDERMKQSLDSLLWPTRATLLLWAVEELTFREIAEVTDVSVATVTSRLRQAHADIAASFGEITA